uniref:Ig-like domain-containing protein n=1 Tax=Esox lucius TaxID=8010 RepID=A0A3P8YYM6_ESOLU
TYLHVAQCGNSEIPSVIQLETHYMSANIGEEVTLLCFYGDEMAMHFSWYKQALGKNPKLISTIYKYDENASFYHEFKGNTRFSVQGRNGMNHLSILNVEISDSAIYYCGRAHSNVVEFGHGIMLNNKTDILILISDSESNRISPGDSVTLNCTINTETCEGEHSVYWFRHDSGESPPGIIYTNGDRSGQCMKSPESWSPTQSCVYNLPKRNLSLSDTGTYYCAVASCGEILFGNGTKLDIQVLRILVLLSIGRTGVLFCFLTILLVIILINKYFN